MQKITISEYKTVLKMFKDWDINPFNYYKDILLNNQEYWHFVNPMMCKNSFKTPYNMLKFIVLKRLIKQGYKLKYYGRNSYGTKEYILSLDGIKKKGQ